MLQNYLHIRMLQLYRELKAVGPLYLLLFLVLFGFAEVMLYQQMSEFSRAIWLPAVLVFAVASVHLSRNDHEFVRLTTHKPQHLFFAEYIVFSSPFWLVMLCTANGYLALSVFPFLWGLSFLRFRNKKRAGWIPYGKWIPADNFEWIGGMRQYFRYLLPLYLLALGMLPFLFVSLFWLWIFQTLLAGFYFTGEPVEVLLASELPPAKFLRRKLLRHLKLFVILILPIVVGYALFHPETAWVAGLFFLLSCTNLCVFILSKYSIYQPNKKLSANSTKITLAFLSVLIPFLLPLPILLCITEYGKAKTRLKPYLDAYH